MEESAALAAPDCVGSTSPHSSPCGSESQRWPWFGGDFVKRGLWRRGWDSNPQGVGRFAPSSGGLIPRNARAKDCSRADIYLNARCPLYHLGDYLPRTPLPLRVRIPLETERTGSIRRCGNVLAEGEGLEPSRGLRPAGFRDRSLSQFGAPLLRPDYRRYCLKVGI